MKEGEIMKNNNDIKRLTQIRKEMEQIKEKAMEQEMSLEASIFKLEFSARTHNILTRAGIKKINDLASLNPKKIENIPLLGNNSYIEIITKFYNNGFLFNEELEDQRYKKMFYGMGILIDNSVEDSKKK